MSTKISAPSGATVAATSPRDASTATSGDDAASLRQALETQAEHLNGLMARTEYLAGRELQLRSMLAAAHEQLLERDRRIARLRAEWQGEAAELHDELELLRREESRLSHELEAHRQEREVILKELEAHQRHQVELLAIIAETQQSAAKEQQGAAEARQSTAEAQQALRRSRDDADTLRGERDRSNKEVGRLKSKIARMESSKAWRLRGLYQRLAGSGRGAE